MKSPSRTTVLLVEDSAVDASLVQGLLRHAGGELFSVTRVTTLAEALCCLKQTDIDVVILDLTLPDSTGLETLRCVVARGAHVPIVVLTGSDEAVGIQAMREGAQDYIPKGQLQGPLLARSVRYAMERHRASRALRESSESLSRVISSAADAIITKDLTGVITSWNPAAERLFGYSAEEVLGKPTPMLFPPERANEEREILARIEKGEKVEHLESVRIRKDGRPVQLALTISPIRNSEGQITGASKIARDISAQKQAEEALRQSEEQLRQSQKMEAVGRLAGGVAHDFNNLLGVILGCAELLAESGDLSQVQKRAEEIRKAGQRAADLTRQLLAFSRKQMIEPKVIDLNAKISEMTDMLKRLVGEDIEIRTSLPADIGRVRADPSQIGQILMNLVVNAREAMPNGGNITIETQNVDLEEEYAGSHTSVLPGRYVMIAVSDSGIGMDAETSAHIFEPFFTTKPSGTGLGLATVYGAVKQSGGNIWVYSEPGKGATFKIYFPRVDGSVDSAGATERGAATSKGSETILLVEDSDSLREVTKEFLKIAGYNVVEARDGKDALRVARIHEERIHLLLTDVVMPGMSGRELADEMKRMRPETRVLFMSGYTSNVIVRRGVLDEELSLLTKPFTRSGLTQKVREMLNS
jgi:PAS domain S-box-containing protein